MKQTARGFLFPFRFAEICRNIHSPCRKLPTLSSTRFICFATMSFQLFRIPSLGVIISTALSPAAVCRSSLSANLLFATFRVIFIELCYGKRLFMDS